MKDKLKKYLLPNLPYLFFVYLFDKLCQTVRLAPGLDVSEKLLHIGQGFQTAFASSAPSFHVLDICVGIFGAILVRLAVYLKAKNAKKYRRGVEYGSARWGRPEDIAPYIDPVPDWNIPLTRTESLTMTSRPKQPKYARNKNILVIGGSGSGKTRLAHIPNYRDNRGCLLHCTIPKAVVEQVAAAGSFSCGAWYNTLLLGALSKKPDSYSGAYYPHLRKQSFPVSSYCYLIFQTAPNG